METKSQKFPCPMSGGPHQGAINLAREAGEFIVVQATSELFRQAFCYNEFSRLTWDSTAGEAVTAHT